jgi:hydroxymethylbilane synthase
LTQIRTRFPELTESELSLKVIKTTGDKEGHFPIASGSTRGVFVKELEEALMAKEIDLAVHSMKDMPTTNPDSLEIRVIPAREDARDTLVSKSRAVFRELPGGAVVGTGSPRRQAQVLAARPDLRVAGIRGNVDTRIQKAMNGDYDAIILACAGLNRLGLPEHCGAPLEFTDMLPAPGQGALALETRKNENRIGSLIEFLHHPATATAVSAERAFLRRLGGGCTSPIAVYAAQDGDGIRIEGLVASADGSKVIRDSVTTEPRLAEESAINLAERILAGGGDSILRPH